MNQKVIVTLWKVELFNIAQTLSNSQLCFNIKYSGQVFQSRRCKVEQLVWKQTFVFRSDNKSAKIEIQYLVVGKQGADYIPTINSGYLGKSGFFIKYLPQQQTLTHKTVDIIQQSGKILGKAQLSYQVYNPHEKQRADNLNYKYLITLSQIELVFKRTLSQKAFMYLKAFHGEQSKLQNIPFQQEEGTLKFKYNYPILYYIDNQETMNFQIITQKTKDVSQMFQLLGKNNHHSQLSQKGKQKKTININTSIIYAIFNLNFAENKEWEEKLIVCIPPSIEIGTLKFKINVEFKQSLIELDLIIPKKKKNIKLSNNGLLSVSSIFIVFDDIMFRNRLLRVQIKLGNQIIQKDLETQSHEVVINETIKFKKIWEQNFEVTVFDMEDISYIKWLCAGKMNLRQFYQTKVQSKKYCKLMNKHEEQIGQLRVQFDYQQNNLFSKNLQINQQQFISANRRVKSLKSKLEKQMSRSLSRRPSKKQTNKYSREDSFDSSNELPPISTSQGSSQYSIAVGTSSTKSPRKQLQTSKRAEHYQIMKNRQSVQRSQQIPLTYRQRVQTIKDRVRLHLPSVNSKYQRD